MKLALIGAVLATLQSAAALASDPSDPAEAPIVVVTLGEEVNEQGEMNNIDLAKNDVDGGAKDDDTSNMDDGAHGAVDGGNQNTAESVQDQHEEAHNDSGQNDN